MTNQKRADTAGPCRSAIKTRSAASLDDTRAPRPGAASRVAKERDDPKRASARCSTWRPAARTSPRHVRRFLTRRVRNERTSTTTHAPRTLASGPAQTIATRASVTQSGPGPRAGDTGQERSRATRQRCSSRPCLAPARQAPTIMPWRPRVMAPRKSAPDTRKTRKTRNQPPRTSAPEGAARAIRWRTPLRPTFASQVACLGPQSVLIVAGQDFLRYRSKVSERRLH